MPRKPTSPKTKSPKTTHVVPEWAKKVKAYREEAKNTQVEVEKAINATVNTMSLIENGRREFTPTQRHLFFELISKPEDTLIPTTVRDLVPTASKIAKPKATKKAKAAKAAKAPKTAKGSMETVETPVPIASPASQGIATEQEATVFAPTVVQPDPRPRKGRKPSKDKALKGITNAVENGTKDVAPKPTRKARNQKLVLVAPAQAEPARPLSSKPAKPATAHAISPVKEAVLRDIIRILTNPGLSDNQAKGLHGLFTSLAVNALLGE